MATAEEYGKIGQVALCHSAKSNVSTTSYCLQ